MSRLVETLLRLVSSRPGGAANRGRVVSPPVLTQLRGSLKTGSVRDYYRHLERKYR